MQLMRIYSTMETKVIPVTMLSGFLGSGKPLRCTIIRLLQTTSARYTNSAIQISLFICIELRCRQDDIAAASFGAEYRENRLRRQRCGE